MAQLQVIVLGFAVGNVELMSVSPLDFKQSDT